jgi:hypothetical protein
MTQITRFGTTNSISLTSNIVMQSYSDNFANVVPRTKRLPDLDGGFDEYGSERAPREIGNVSITFTMIAPTADDMDARRRDIRETANWGTDKLFRLVDFDTIEQWCYARVNSIQMAESVAGLDYLWQSVTINFQVADPAWYGQGTETWTWGDGTLWGSKPWGGDAPVNNASGTETDFTINVSGNLVTYPRISLIPGIGNSCTNPVIQRIVDGVAVDEVSYSGTLTNTDSLQFNTRKRSFTLNGSSAFNDVDFINGRIFTLEPGNNTIRVQFDNAGDAATLRLYYFERYI